MLFNPLTADETTALNTVADTLSIPVAWLNNLISFESDWNPKAVNNSSGASGLIQFMDKTAQGLGYASASALVSQYPDRQSQLLGPVLTYLSAYKPFPTEQSLYMAVFYPKARNWPADTDFSAQVQAANPGIKTVQDYINKVTFTSTFNNLKPLAIVALSIFGVITLLKIS